MPHATPAGILRRLAHNDTTTSDRDLLARFVAERDDTAFADLVRRHGPVVLAACRRGTRNRHDADDAFQAVFLTLARRADSVRNPDLLGNWLYQVAVRVAWRARRAASRRRVHEVPTADLPEAVAPAPPEHGDLGPVLDEELARLPAWHRDALVLCDLQGLARADAAARLGVPLGTLASRLDKARKKLAAGLTRRGVTLSAAAVPGVLADLRAAAVPASLLDKACGLATGAAPRVVIQLAHGGVMMRMVTTVGLVAASLAVVGVGLSAQPGDSQTPVAPPPRPVVDVAAPPKGVVLRAWEEALAGLKSGVGEGQYEVTERDGTTTRYAMKVVHAGPKYRAELARVMDGEPAPRLVPTLVAIYDGNTLAHRAVSANEEARLVQIPPRDSHQPFPLPYRFEFNPTRLLTGVMDLTELVRAERPVITFSRGTDDIAAAYSYPTGRLTGTGHIHRTTVSMVARFPRETGYRLQSVDLKSADGEFEHRSALSWARSGGVWYVREVSIRDNSREPLLVSQRLRYSTFEANVKVDPGSFTLPALGLAPGRRLILMDPETNVAEFYSNDLPVRPARADDTLLDGLRRLPRQTVGP